MKKLLTLAVALLASIATANVSTNVYLYDGTTPLPPADPNVPNLCRDVMVGTKLVIILSSDTPIKYWNGALLVPREEWAYGTLSGRDYNEKRISYDGSCLPGAGQKPFAQFRSRQTTIGFDLNTDRDAVAGDWFVFDYLAVQTGPCTLGLYDYSVTNAAPIDTMILNHVPSRDFTGDAIVDWSDFALLAAQWQAPPATDPNTLASAAADPNAVAAVDLNADARIDALDVALFCDYWLERTDYPKPPPEPNTP
jgi:hypothetical protein